MRQIVHSPESLGKSLQRIRRSKSMTQEDVGANFKIDQTTISSIEMGAKGTRIETLFRLLAALDLELVLQDKKSRGNEKVDW